jgi:hypothetical protein
LSCQCRVEENTAFVGIHDSCTGDNGGIMSSMTMEAWDFENNTYTFPMPGYEYVQGACAPLTSDPDPWPPQCLSSRGHDQSTPCITACSSTWRPTSRGQEKRVGPVMRRGPR